MRDILADLNKNLSKSPEREGPEHKLFQKLLLITHYNTMRCSCVGNDQLDPIAAKLSISLLRHIDLIPADKAFYEAGLMCQVINLNKIQKLFNLFKKMPIFYCRKSNGTIWLLFF